MIKSAFFSSCISVNSSDGFNLATSKHTRKLKRHATFVHVNKSNCFGISPVLNSWLTFFHKQPPPLLNQM